MNDLIPFKENSEFPVDARDVHSYLEIGTRFDTWWERRCTELGLREVVDYMLTFERSLIPYLRVDTAKHLAMIQKNDKGHALRQWFIDREKKLSMIDGRPMTSAERLRANAQMHLQALDDLIEHERKISLLESKLEDTRKIAVQATAYNSGNTGFFTVRGFAKIRGLKLSTGDAIKMGKLCTSLLRAEGGKPKETIDERYGSVYSYPEAILEEAFKLE